MVDTFRTVAVHWSNIPFSSMFIHFHPFSAAFLLVGLLCYALFIRALVFLEAASRRCSPHSPDVPRPSWMRKPWVSAIRMPWQMAQARAVACCEWPWKLGNGMSGPCFGVLLHVHAQEMFMHNFGEGEANRSFAANRCKYRWKYRCKSSLWNCEVWYP